MAEGANTEWRLAEPSDDDAIIRMCLALNAEDPGDTAVPPAQVHRTLDVLPRAIWLKLIAAAGFEPLAVPFEHSPYSNAGREVFLGLRPVAGEEA